MFFEGEDGLGLGVGVVGWGCGLGLWVGVVGWGCELGLGCVLALVCGLVGVGVGVGLGLGVVGVADKAV
jgi:hypothetical protein